MSMYTFVQVITSVIQWVCGHGDRPGKYINTWLPFFNSLQSNHHNHHHHNYNYNHDLSKIYTAQKYHL